MKTLLIMTAAFAMSGNILFADCSRISETNALYKSVMQSTASLRDIKRLQQMVGVRADGFGDSAATEPTKSLSTPATRTRTPVKRE